jgi:hypothetical protein
MSAVELVKQFRVGQVVLAMPALPCGVVQQIGFRSLRIPLQRCCARSRSESLIAFPFALSIFSQPAWCSLPAHSAQMMSANALSVFRKYHIPVPTKADSTPSESTNPGQ